MKRTSVNRNIMRRNHQERSAINKDSTYRNYMNKSTATKSNTTRSNTTKTITTAAKSRTNRTAMNNPDKRRTAGQAARRYTPILSLRTILAIFTLLLILGGVLLGSSWSDARRSEASADHSVYKYYTTVTVENGDTLWTLADSYMDDQYQNKREFIAEVKQLNQIDENRIHEGTQLLIPYYSPEYL